VLTVRASNGTIRARNWTTCRIELFLCARCQTVDSGGMIGACPHCERTCSEGFDAALIECRRLSQLSKRPPLTIFGVDEVIELRRIFDF
jgi:hypothetical protein